MTKRVLLVEDDVFLRDGLFDVLSGEGFSVTVAENFRKAKSFSDSEKFDIVILDVLLPDGNGLDLCTHIRSVGNDVPILFLTACDDEIQIVRGLDAGADDYVTKPFKLRELLSRIRALLRRSAQTSQLSVGSISIDTANMSVKKDGKNIVLTPTEFHILLSLIRNKGIIVTRSQLLRDIWDCDGDFIDDNTLSVHISRLRDKIGASHILTVRGVGYRWEE